MMGDGKRKRIKTENIDTFTKLNPKMMIAIDTQIRDDGSQCVGRNFEFHVVSFGDDSTSHFHVLRAKKTAQMIEVQPRASKKC